MATPRRRGALLLDLNACSLLSAALLRERLREAGIKPEQFDLLTEIQLGRPITPTELALRTGYRPATLYDHVEQLLARGHIERSPNPRDHRSYHLSTTPAGGEALRLGSKAVGQVGGGCCRTSTSRSRSSSSGCGSSAERSSRRTRRVWSIDNAGSGV